MAVNRQFSRGLFLKSAYTWSKAINWTDEDGWASVGWNWGPVMDRNRAVAGYNRAQMFTFGFLYEMPFGPGNAWATSGPASWLLRGWQTNGTYAAYTGTPFTMGAAGTSLNAPGNSQTTDGDTRKGESSAEIGANKSWFVRWLSASQSVRFGTTDAIRPGLTNQAELFQLQNHGK